MTTDRSNPPPRVFLSTDTLHAGRGGIGRVARLMARVLGEMQSAGKLTVCGVVLNDSKPSDDIPIQVKCCGESRLRFVACNRAASISSSYFIYDSVSMARAHNTWWPWRRPYMTWIHGIEVWEDARADHLRCARRADVLLSNTDSTRQRADRIQGDFQHAQVCWLATEVDEAPVPAPRAHLPPTVLLLGRIDRDSYKGHAEMLDCWPRVLAAVPDARLLFVGHEGDSDYWRRQINEKKLDGSVELLGFVPDSQMEQVWNRTTVLSMPSRGEGFGLVYIEAMQRGIPIVGTIHDSTREINVQGETGFNVDMNDPTALPDRLIRLMQDRQLADQFGQNGYRRWHDHFRYSAFRDRFVPLVNQFLGLHG